MFSGGTEKQHRAVMGWIKSYTNLSRAVFQPFNVYLITSIKNNSFSVNQFQPNVAFHIETSHLFFRAKRMTGFYMKCNTGLEWIKMKKRHQLTTPVSLLHQKCSRCKSSSLKVLLAEGALKICSKFTGEHPCQSVISVKLQNKTLAWVFSSKFTAYFQNTLSLRTPLDGCFGDFLVVYWVFFKGQFLLKENFSWKSKWSNFIG